MNTQEELIQKLIQPIIEAWAQYIHVHPEARGKITVKMLEGFDRYRMIDLAIFPNYQALDIRRGFGPEKVRVAENFLAFHELKFGMTIPRGFPFIEGRERPERYTFDEARQVANEMCLTSRKDYGENRLRDLRLPPIPSQAYRDRWISWKHFLSAHP